MQGQTAWFTPWDGNVSRWIFIALVLGSLGVMFPVQAQDVERFEEPSKSWEPPGLAGKILEVTSKPEGAVVLRNGEVFCRATPCKRWMDFGTYQLSMILEGHAKRTRDLVVTNNDESNKVEWELAPNGGWLKVVAPEEGIEVLIDGFSVGKTPLERFPVSAGRHRVSLQSPCYDEVEAFVSVGKGKEAEVVLSPEARVGVLKVLVEDDDGKSLGAKVLVDGKEVGDAPGDFKVSICAKEAEVRHKEGVRKEKIELKERRVTPLRVVLNQGSSARVDVKSSTSASTGLSRVRFTDVGQIYSTINTTDCLQWPQDAMKNKAGQNAWGSYYPSNGNEGFVVYETPHCNSASVTVLIVQVGERLVPIGETGVRYLTRASSKREEMAEITNTGELYTTINQGECLPWPDPQLKSKAGQKSWNGYYPRSGEKGPIVWSATHCNGKTRVYVLKIKGHFVPIGERGVRKLGLVPQQSVSLGALELGSTVKVISTGYIYENIARTDCLTWPDPAMKKRGSRAAWGKYTPKNGDVGQVVGRAQHCRKNNDVFLVEIKGNIVPVEGAGLQFQHK